MFDDLAATAVRGANRGAIKPLKRQPCISRARLGRCGLVARIALVARLRPHFSSPGRPIETRLRSQTRKSASLSHRDEGQPLGLYRGGYDRLKPPGCGTELQQCPGRRRERAADSEVRRLQQENRVAFLVCDNHGTRR